MRKVSIKHFHAHGKPGCVKDSHRNKLEIEEKKQRVRKRVRHVWRKVQRPWKKVFGRRESWIGTFYLH